MGFFFCQEYPCFVSEKVGKKYQNFKKGDLHLIIEA